MVTIDRQLRTVILSAFSAWLMVLIGCREAPPPLAEGNDPAGAETASIGSSPLPEARAPGEREEAAPGMGQGTPTGPAAGTPGGTTPQASIDEEDEDALVTPGPLPPGGEMREGKLIHTVSRGESLGLISIRYLPFTSHLTPIALQQAIQAHNRLTRKHIPVGQHLEIPDLEMQRPRARTVPRDRRWEARGIYITMTSASSERMFDLIDALKPLGLNTVVIDVKDMDGLVAYPTRVPLAVKTGASRKGPIRDMNKLVHNLHRLGMHVVARQVLFHDRFTAVHEPRLALRAKGGGIWKEHGKQVWVDPADPEVQDYNIALAREVASLGVDEIQFDYIRFPAMGDVAGIDYSFDLSKTPKHQVITGFLERAYKALKPTGVLVSIDVYGVVAWDKGKDIEVTGQRLEDLGRFADVVSPMVYPSHYYPPFDGHAYPAWEPHFFVYQGVVKAAKKLEGTGATIRPWLQAFPFMVKDRFTPDYVATQLRAAAEASATGWLLWDAQNEYLQGRRGVELWNRQREALAQRQTLDEGGDGATGPGAGTKRPEGSSPAAPVPTGRATP